MNFCEKLIKENAIEAEPVNEVSAAVAAGAFSIAVLAGQVVYGLLKWNQSKKKDAEDKKKEEFFKNHPAVKKATDELYDFGDKFAETVASRLKEYAKSQKDNPIYKNSDFFNINDIKPEYYQGFDVEFSSSQEFAVEDAYFDLQKNGVRIAKELAKEMNKDEKYHIGIDTGDGDEGVVYITIEFGKKLKDELRAQVEADYKSKSVNEAADASQDPPREEQKKALSDLEFSYDKKYNAFCLSVSGYSTEKLEGMLQKKTEELKAAKEEKQKAPTRYSRMAAQIKIDYLVNVTNRCKAMIRKKKSYHKAEEKK